MNGVDELIDFPWHETRYVLASSTERVHCVVSSGANTGNVVWESDEIYPATSPRTRMKVPR